MCFQVFNYGEKVVTNKMRGYLPMRIVQFLSNIHTHKHTIYLTRHGQSDYNVLGKLGGNPGLSPAGQVGFAYSASISCSRFTFSASVPLFFCFRSGFLAFVPLFGARKVGRESGTLADGPGGFGTFCFKLLLSFTFVGFRSPVWAFVLPCRLSFHFFVALVPLFQFSTILAFVHLFWRLFHLIGFRSTFLDFCSKARVEIGRGNWV
jgi:hypothetical protein